MDNSPYHRRPLTQQDDESDEEGNPFDSSGMDPTMSTDRIPLTAGMSRQNIPPLGTSPPFDRPASRYTLTENPASNSSSTNLAGGYAGSYGGRFGQGRLHFPEGGRPVSVLSNTTDDWIQRQQPIQASQADLRRYQTRRVKLNQGSVFSADYPY